AQLPDRGGGERLQPDLAALLAAAGLDLDLEDAEGPLHQALVDVERLDPRERDRRLRDPQQPAAVADRPALDPGGGRAPADQAAGERDGDADAAVERRADQPAGVEAAAQEGDRGDDEERQ